MRAETGQTASPTQPPPADGAAIGDRFEALRAEMLAFLGGRRARLPELGRPMGAAMAAIEAARLPLPPPAPRRLPGRRHLEAALALAENGPMAALARAFAALEPSLRWLRSEHYRAQLGDGYMDNYGFTNLLGYDALIPHGRVVVAFLVIGPGRCYPRHRHEAEEIYFPFGGDALWSLNDEAPRPRPAGEPVHNAPWTPHSMTTRGDPLFTFCFWLSPGPIRLAQLDRQSSPHGGRHAP